ncbi:hypothetical protein DFH08DRAFT_904654 [Mycena albidolilacea]|uniref:Uncharacterized protein n=1 Tax=Mycena albidolilacea TaxID=1033008 RepID=A0AAD6Z0K8_9AGAR|nr:hypothetical protein DFH08DRAFT_904654 [Mycena albidolilacea]
MRDVVRLDSILDIHFSKHRRSAAVYLAGSLFALANWLFLDACIFDAHAKPWRRPHEIFPIHVTTIDWIPGLYSLLGFLLNLIDRERLRHRRNATSSDIDARAR